MLWVATSLVSGHVLSSSVGVGASEVRLASGVSSISLPANAATLASFPHVSLAQTSSTLSQPSSSEVTLSNAEVAQLQTLLRRAGYYNGEIDGDYGDETRRALLEFQRRFKLADTGEVDSDTWRALQTLDPDIDISGLGDDENAPATIPDDSEPAEGEASPESIASSPDTDVNLDAPSDADAETSAEDPEDTESSGTTGLDWLRRLLIVSVVLGVASTVAYALAHYGLVQTPRSRQVSLWLRRFTAPPAPPSATARSAAASRRFRQSHSTRAIASPPQTHVPKASDAVADSAAADNAEPVESSISDEPELMLPTRVTPLSQTDVTRQLTLDLHHTDPSIRRKAIWELGQQGNSDAILTLTELMPSSDSHQRCLLLAAISEIGIRTLRPMNRALIVSLQDESVDVRKNAIREITRIYDLVTQVSYHLRHAVDDADEEVRKTAQWALSRIDRTLAQSDTTLPDLSTLVQSNEPNSATRPDNVEMSAMNRLSGDRPTSH